MDHDNPLMMEKGEYEIARPNAGSLMQSLRAFGYDIATAIADLIDNSITARSDRISIQFEWNNGEPWIAVADNGYGMTESELFEAMKTGSKNPLDYRDERDLGRFGLGLKTASFSQCKRLTVASKTRSTPLNIRCWDLDLVTENNEWVLLKRVSYDTESLIKDIFRDRESGTVVLWEKIDRIIPGNHINDDEYQDAFLGYAKAVKEHISVVFCSYMQGPRRVHFEINGMGIEMWDPFMMDNTLTTRMPVETLYVDGHEVVIRPFILPHQNKLSPELFVKYAGKHGWNAQQGYYIFRNNRLIVAADWLVQGLEKLEQYRLARIRIDIGNETDSEWNIDVRKSTAVPPISITKEIKRIAIAARRESARIYRHRGKKLARKSKEEQSFVWHQNVRNGKLGYFYKPHLEDLWFRETILADPDTMSYNNAWGGTIPFPRENWKDWFDYWIANPNKRFYRYITTGNSRSYVGEAAYHYDLDMDLYLADIIISAKSRRLGFGKAGLLLLCEAAKNEKIPELYDNIAIDNPGISLFFQCGFEEEYRTEEIIMLKKTL